MLPEEHKDFFPNTNLLYYFYFYRGESPSAQLQKGEKLTITLFNVVYQFLLFNWKKDFRCTEKLRQIIINNVMLITPIGLKILTKTMTPNFQRIT